MASLNMIGPFKLNAERVDEIIKFKYSYASNIKEAFEKECKNYHDFGGWDSLDNIYHPARLEGTDYKCPICNN